MSASGSLLSLSEKELLLLHELLTFVITHYEGTDAMTDDALDAFLRLQQKINFLLEVTAFQRAVTLPHSNTSSQVH